MIEGFNEKLQKAVESKDKCGVDYCTISIEHDWTIKVYAHPTENRLHQVVSALTHLVGKLEKRQEAWGTSFEFNGQHDGIEVRIMTPEQCKIVGYKIEKRPKRVTVESSEVEIIKTPVTDCDFRAGKVKAGEFEPLPKEGA